jgi:hypothetical protein
LTDMRRKLTLTLSLVLAFAGAASADEIRPVSFPGGPPHLTAVAARRAVTVLSGCFDSEFALGRFFISRFTIPAELSVIAGAKTPAPLADRHDRP